MLPKEIPLGFEIGTGIPVSIPVRNMVVTGQTQEAGKTTTLEALIDRAQLDGFAAIAFITKRGEGAFQTRARGRPEPRHLQPYMRQRADWQFVASILEATMREKMRLERSWIIKASKGARDLADVQHNVRALLPKASGLSESIYTTLEAYLDIVVPRLKNVRWAQDFDLRDGLNLMDISDRELFPAEIQALVIRSVLEAIYEERQGTITVLPEAWEFLPQERGSPVKLAATELIRKGSTLHNHIWLDSQDIGGVDKTILRSCPVWLLGVQRETNEIKRTLANIPATIAKPKPGEIATLERGQFFACYGRHVVKVYVQPAWMKPSDAQLIAKHPEQAGVVMQAVNAECAAAHLEKPMAKDDPPSLLRAVTENTAKIDRLTSMLEKFVEQGVRAQVASERIISCAMPAVKIDPSIISEKPKRPDLAGHSKTGNGDVDLQQIYEYVLDRLKREAPAIISVLAQVPEIEVREEKRTIETDTKSLFGMITILISEGFLDAPVNGNKVHAECRRRFNYGGTSSVRSYEQLGELHKLGFLVKEKDGYQAVPGMKKRIRRVEA